MRPQGEHLPALVGDQVVQVVGVARSSIPPQSAEREQKAAVWGRRLLGRGAPSPPGSSAVFPRPALDGPIILRVLQIVAEANA